jgi:hypothetical protein
VELVLPPLPDEPRGTARPEAVPPPRRCPSRSERGAGRASLGWEPQLLPEPPDEEPPEEPPDEDPPDEDPDEEPEEPPPLSRGTADPVVSPLDGRDPDWASRAAAPAGAILSVKAEAINPTVSF